MNTSTELFAQLSVFFTVVIHTHTPTHPHTHQAVICQYFEVCGGGGCGSRAADIPPPPPPPPEILKLGT